MIPKSYQKEPASVRVKFTPLFQNIDSNGSNYYLEIVPEVASTHNLNKIKWRNEENCVEYTIPITFKIIITKKRVHCRDENVKTYHSCVDLLLRSPETEMNNFDSGDVSRSDTFVLNRITTDIDPGSIHINGTNANNAFFGNVENKKMLQTNNIIFKDIKSNKKDASTIIESMADAQSTWVSNTRVNILNYQYNSADQNTIAPQIITYNDNSSELEKLKCVTFKAHDHVSHLVMPNDVCNIEFGQIKYNAHKKHRNFKDIPLENNMINAPRSLPKKRASYFVKQMQEEISPLKIMLNELINECSIHGSALRKTQERYLFRNNLSVRCEQNICNNANK